MQAPLPFPKHCGDPLMQVFGFLLMCVCSVISYLICNNNKNNNDNAFIMMIMIIM